MDKQPEALRLAAALAWHESAAVEQAADELRRQHALIAELVAVAQSVERIGAISRNQAECEKERAGLGWMAAGEDGCFGIAVRTDSAALRWQELEKERNALIAASRAALSTAKEQ